MNRQPPFRNMILKSEIKSKKMLGVEGGGKDDYVTLFELIL